MMNFFFNFSQNPPVNLLIEPINLHKCKTPRYNAHNLPHRALSVNLYDGCSATSFTASLS